jgi:hypothetical protein
MLAINTTASRVEVSVVPHNYGCPVRIIEQAVTVLVQIQRLKQDHCCEIVIRPRNPERPQVPAVVKYETGTRINEDMRICLGKIAKAHQTKRQAPNFA